MESDTKSNVKRKPYFCRKCKQPKRGHKCPYVSSKSKKLDGNAESDEDLELSSNGDEMSNIENLLSSPEHSPKKVKTSHLFESELSSRSPRGESTDFNSSSIAVFMNCDPDIAMEDVDRNARLNTFRTRVTELLEQAQRNTETLHEDHQYYYSALTRTTKELEDLLHQMDQTYLSFSEPSDEYQYSAKPILFQTGRNSYFMQRLNGGLTANIYCEGTVDCVNFGFASFDRREAIKNIQENSPEVLFYLHILLEEFSTIWTKDRRTGKRNGFEEKVFAMWDKAFRKLQLAMTREVMYKWMKIAISYDTRGLLKLDTCLTSETVACAIQVLLEMMDYNPKFQTYLSIQSKLIDTDETHMQLKESIIRQLLERSANNQDVLSVLLNVLLYEKRLDDVKAILHHLPGSNKHVKDCLEKLAKGIDPEWAVEKALDELKKSLAESIPLLEGVFLPNNKDAESESSLFNKQAEELRTSYSRWMQEKFVDPAYTLLSDDPSLSYKLPISSLEDLPNDHYLVCLVRTLCIEDEETDEDQTEALMNSSSGMSVRGSLYLNSNGRLKSRLVSAVPKLDEIIGMFYIIKVAFKHGYSNPSSQEQTYNDFVQTMESYVKDYISQNSNIEEFGLICKGLAIMTSSWPIHPQYMDLGKLVALFAAISQGMLINYLDLSLDMKYYETKIPFTSSTQRDVFDLFNQSTSV